MNPSDRLVVCRGIDKQNPEVPTTFGVLPAFTISLRRPVPVQEISFADLLRDLTSGRLAYHTAFLGSERDKLAVVLGAPIHRIVGADGTEWVATKPDDTSRENLAALPTRAQFDRWLLRYASTL